MNLLKPIFWDSCGSMLVQRAVVTRQVQLLVNVDFLVTQN